MRHFVFALFAIVPSLAAGQVIINPTGGTTASNGIRVTIGNTGQIQVLRLNSGQLYSPTGTAGATTNSSMTNGVYVAIGNTVVGPQNFATVASAGVTLQAWTPVSNTLTPQGNGGTATTVLRATVGGRNYDLTITWQYTYPNDFVVVTHSLAIPSGNTATVRLYHVADAYLAADDFGPSFFSLGPPAIVGGYRVSANIVEAWRYRGGINWTGYFAGFYACLFDAADCPAGQINSVNSAGTFTNYIEPTTVDNSFGIMWNFGSAPGTYASQNDLTFYSYQPQLSKRFGASAITVPQSTSLTFTIDNVPGALPQTNLGFTDTLPSGLTISSAVLTNTCNGTVTTSSGAAIGVGSTSVRLTNGSMAMGTSRCTIVVQVTSSNAGAYTNGRTNITGLSVLENQVSDQTLAVVQGAPIVRLNPPGAINDGNDSAYTVSGTCQDSNGVVTVRVGALMTTTPCSGNTFSTTFSVASLADGASITVQASQNNAAGTGTDSANTSKDTTAPGVPTFTSPANGAITNDNTPTFEGTGEPGATVRVTVGNNEVCSAVVGAGGNWTCTGNMLPDGPVTVVVRATDPAGNTGVASPGRTLTIDTTAPAAPTITSPAPSAVVAPNPSISGTAEAGATVLVFEGTTQLCSTAANASGQWTCATTLGIGSHTVHARQIDRATNQGPASANRTFLVDNVPTVRLNTPGPINVANATAFPVSGTCTTSAGAVTVQVGSLPAVTTACTAGTFSRSENASSLVDSTVIVLTASQTNATGTGTDTRNTIKDTQAPTTPVITTPAEMSFGNLTTPTITGTGEPGSTVVVSSGVGELCRTQVPPTGQWACTTTALLPGQVQLTARATDSAENQSAVSPTRTFTIDITPPGEPTIVTPTQNASVAPLPTLSGSAEPFAQVNVFEGTALVCSVTADASGNWTCPTTLATGPHTLIARQVDRAGNRSNESQPRTFSVEGLPNVLLNTPADITGANAATYIVSGACTANAGNVTVSVGLSSAMVPCANGMFSATMDVRGISDGTGITVRASQTTAAGTGADTRTVNKDASPPDAPNITTPAPNTVTTSNNPPISGTAEPGSVVSVYLNGNLVGTTVANAQGMWTFNNPTALADGIYEVSATATDAGGNTGMRAMGPRFTVDGTAPVAPTITQPDEGDSHDEDKTLVITGEAEAGSTVTIYIDGREVGTTEADATRRFSLAVDPATLGTGPHAVEADARDAAGNRGPKSAPVRFTINQVDERFGGQGLVGCTTTGGFELLGLAVLALLRRRQGEVRS